MHREPNKKLIGLFMISGIAVLLIIIATVMGSKLFSANKKTLVMYFEESINGLNVGSSVVFKGVEIGKVSKIDLIANTQKLDFSIPVYVTMTDQQGIKTGKRYANNEAILNALVDKGLRARLTTQSYLTGQLMIELEMLPDTPIVFRKRNPDSDILEIPTVLSPIGAISKGFQDLPVKDSVEQFNKFFTSLNEQLPQILPQIKEMSSGMNKLVKDNSKVTAETLDNLNKAAVDVSQAAKALRNFADYIERHPEALLKGKRGGNE